MTGLSFWRCQAREQEDAEEQPSEPVYLLGTLEDTGLYSFLSEKLGVSAQ